ncbi:TPA: SRPBCC family protein [Elizabethkingia meningoseptica]|uniref:SRPBCC family protein n=1 Tax=Elizabethkingia meningoseptica TaxID=238 RepID=UPI0022F180C6|nr:SRPBCC family protein [Elizabethkingia meningoseptica]EJK5330696.1 SRPBCC family protein [Elizabethkingia meningoseptica]WBS76616.1 SRPBCC family protein [Elizabethkingia meningoseptica]HAY3564271.1 SRPBCC family protein [Elizabethkingia meningoseptica]
MPVINLKILINADIHTVFDLSRSIDLHSISTAKTNEKAIAGVTSGLIKAGETVTWEATHFSIRQTLTSKITAFEEPFHFRDEMLQGTFKYIRHDHYFETTENGTLMTDIFRYDSPYGLLGKLFNQLILTRYLKKFLQERNQVIKDFAESDQWKQVLK